MNLWIGDRNNCKLFEWSLQYSTINELTEFQEFEGYYSPLWGKTFQIGRKYISTIYNESHIAMTLSMSYSSNWGYIVVTYTLIVVLYNYFGLLIWFYMIYYEYCVNLSAFMVPGQCGHFTNVGKIRWKITFYVFIWLGQYKKLCAFHVLIFGISVSVCELLFI